MERSITASLTHGQPRGAVKLSLTDQGRVALCLGQLLSEQNTFGTAAVLFWEVAPDARTIAEVWHLLYDATRFATLCLGFAALPRA
eukprot:4535542-Amphidinium_carterae.1